MQPGRPAYHTEDRETLSWTELSRPASADRIRAADVTLGIGLGRW